MTISSSSSSSSSGESHHHPSAVELDIVPNLAAAAAAAAGGGGIGGSQSEVVFVKCDCCGLTEECTETYIAKVRERYQGRWICGLCAEAVKDEIFRSAYHQHQSQTTTTTTTTTTTESGTISTEEALNRHMNFCNKFKSSHPPPNPTKHLISAMKQLLRRSSSLTTTIRSTPPTSPHPPRPRPKEMITEPRRRLSRSESCFTTLAS